MNRVRQSRGDENVSRDGVWLNGWAPVLLSKPSFEKNCSLNTENMGAESISSTGTLSVMSSREFYLRHYMHIVQISIG